MVENCCFPPSEYFDFLSFWNIFLKSEVNYLSFEIKIVYVTDLESNASQLGQFKSLGFPSLLKLYPS